MLELLKCDEGPAHQNRIVQAAVVVRPEKIGGVSVEIEGLRA